VRQPKKGTRCARVITFLDETFFFGGGGAYALCAANGTAPFPGVVLEEKNHLSRKRQGFRGPIGPQETKARMFGCGCHNAAGFVSPDFTKQHN
jgi:hypothetical protein